MSTVNNRRRASGRSRDNQPKTVCGPLLVPAAGQSLSRFLRTSLYAQKVSPLIGDFAHYRGKPPQRLVEDNLQFVTEKYFPYLEFDVIRQIDPRMAEYGRVKEALERLAEPSNGLPARVATKAGALYEMFEAINWNATPRTPAARHVVELSGSYPPSNHPIWGENGIMHGLVMDHGPGGNVTYRLDSRYTPRDANIICHNGLRVGQWFPMRWITIFHGAHSQPIRGIAGDPNRGAYSIVVAGEYEEVDRDEGDVIYYSAEGGATKDARRKADSKLNQALNTSLRTRGPVRVLRSAKLKSNFAPPCGIRYDGLYQIVSVQIRMNEHGGRFQLFKLERQPD